MGKKEKWKEKRWKRKKKKVKTSKISPAANTWNLLWGREFSKKKLGGGKEIFY